MARSSAFSQRRTRQMPVVRKRWLLDDLARQWTVPTRALPAHGAEASPAAIALTTVVPAPLPAAWPISETFTGTNGSAWYAGRWDAGSGQAPTIVGNRGDFTSATGTADIEVAALKPALLANQNGRVEIRLDNFIVDTASLIYFAMKDTTVSGLDYGFLIATDGSSVQAGVPSYGTFTDSITLVANDTLHHRIVRDSTTGLLQWYYWVNAATEPTTPNFEVYSFDIVSVDEFWVGRIQDDARSVRYDNLTIVAPKAFPAAIAIGPDFGTLLIPAPTVTGGSSGGGTAIPAAVALTVVTPAPTTRGSSNTTPAAIALSAVTPAPTASGASNTTPAAIALTVVTPAPTASGNSATTPAAIAISAVLYDYLGYPVVSNASSTFGNTASVIAPMTVSGTVVGDLILVLVGSTTLVAPAGYTKLFEQATATSFTIWGRIATGTTADAFYSNTANQATYNMWRVTHHGVVTLASDIKVSSGATTATNTFDPPSLDAGSSDQWLWIAAAYYGSSIGGLFTNTAPTGYSGVVRGNSGGSGVASNTIWAWKQSTSQTDDPATMTCSTASANVLSGVAVTLAVTPQSHTAVSGSSNTTPAAVALVVVVPAPTASGTSNTTPTAIALTVVTPAPTASGDARAPPAAVALAATTPAPTATGGADGTALPTAIALTTSLGTATASGSATASPATISLSTTTTTPTGTGTASTTPTAITLSAVLSAPTASGDANTAPAAIVLADTVPPPTAGGQGVASPSTIALSVTTPPATATGTANTTPAVVALSVVTPPPTATGQTVATPAAITLTATTPAPTASGQGVAFPTAITLTVVTPAPQATGATGSSAAPAAVPLTVVTPQPTASGDANTAPAAIALSATLGVATASGGTGTSTSPAAIALTVSLGVATASGGTGGTASPATIALTVSLTSPTGTGTANATPATIARTVVCPAPQATGSSAATAAPAAVMLTVVVPTPTVTGGGGATPPTIDLAATTVTPDTTGTIVYFPYWGARVG